MSDNNVGTFADTLRNILATPGLAAPPAPAPAPSGGVDMNSMLVLIMQQQQQAMERAERAAQERAQQTTTLITTAITTLAPLLFKPKEADPVMVKLLESLANRESSKEVFQNAMTMQQASAQANMDTMRKSLETMMETKDRLTDRMIERIEDKLERGEGGGAKEGTGNMFVDGLGHVARIMEKLPGRKPAGDDLAQATAIETATGPAPVQANPTALLAPGTGQPTTASTAPTAVATAPAARAAPDRQAHIIKLILMTLRRLHQETLTDRQRHVMRAQLIAAIVGIPDLCDAIVDEDSGKLVEITAPVAQTDPGILAWVLREDTQAWLGDYLPRTIAPGLLEITEGEDATAEGDGDGDTEAQDDGDTEAVTEDDEAAEPVPAPVPAPVIAAEPTKPKRGKRNAEGLPAAG